MNPEEKLAIESPPSILTEVPRLQVIVETLQNKKGLDIAVMDLRQVSDAADFFVLCTGTSDAHVRALSEDVVDSMRRAGDRPWHVEGTQTRRWVLVDLVDIVIHILRSEAREFYALERLWGDAEIHRFEDQWDDPTQPLPLQGIPGADAE